MNLSTQLHETAKASATKIAYHFMANPVHMPNWMGQLPSLLQALKNWG